MRSRFVFSVLALAALSVRGDSPSDTSGTEDEFSKESSLKVIFPSALFSKSLEHSEALFGRPSYGSSVTGIIVSTNSSGCPDDPTRMPASASGAIVLVDRRTDAAKRCHFTQVVKAAENAGALAVLIDTEGCGDSSCADQPCGTNCPTVLPFMSDDGAGGDINIPSMLIWRADAVKMRNCMAGTDPACTTPSTVSAELRWNMPINDGGVQKVAVDFFSSSDDQKAVLLKQALEPVMRALGNRVKFTPHYYIYDGTKLQCTTVVNCGTQCTNKGRYCEPDPDRQFGTDLEGMNVVEENLRQAALWRTYADADPTRWWEYVNEFFTRCNGPKSKSFNTACAEAAMRAVNVDVDMVNAKMNQPSYGQQDDNTNIVLQDEMKLTNDLAIVSLPTVIVNGLILRGSLGMPSIFNAICHGYAPTADTPAPTVCDCVPVDGGSAVNEAQLKRCIADGGPKSTDGGSGSPAGGVSPGAVVGLFIAFLVVVGVAGYGYYHFMQRRMREQVHNFLSEYVPLDDINDSARTSASNPGASDAAGSGDAQI